jgi:leucine dehydrogenase
MINVANELEGFSQDRAEKKAEGIYDLMKRVIEISKKEDLPTSEAANLMAEARISQVKRLKQRQC